jgi:glycosyltransferase involved in cell wall biosynthesis
MAMSDCGVFPVRCEAGTNHFLMEYMACGRPAIATFTSGLVDILRPGLNSVGLQSFRQVQPALSTGRETRRGLWNEPALDEIVEALESLYASGETRTRLGRAAAHDMHRFAWPECAERLLHVIDAAQSDMAIPGATS